MSATQSGLLSEVTEKPTIDRRLLRLMLMEDRSQKMVEPVRVYSYWRTSEMLGVVDTLIEIPPPEGLMRQLSE